MLRLHYPFNSCLHFVLQALGVAHGHKCTVGDIRLFIAVFHEQRLSRYAELIGQREVVALFEVKLHINDSADKNPLPVMNVFTDKADGSDVCSQRTGTYGSHKP